MGKLGCAALGLGLGGCSLIYNPSNLPATPSDGRGADAMADAEVIVDADPGKLALTMVSPAQIYEGQGDGGSRAAMIVIDGTQMVAGAKITLTKPDHSAFTGAVVDDANTVVADDGKQIAAPVKFLVDPLLTSSGSVALDVTVTQPAGGTMVSKTLSGMLTEKGLDEITDTPSLKILQAGNKIASGTYLVSSVNIVNTTGGKGLLPADTSGPVIIRAIASVNIAGLIAMDGTGQAAGPGGNSGGAGGASSVGGSAPGSQGGGLGGGHPNGGGGGFKAQGGAGVGAGGPPSGEQELLTISVSGTGDAGSGGAGGAGGTLAVGGAGGGGGGTVEITAGGDLTLASVEANGGNGVGASSGNGGGGSGGAVLLRTGGTLAVAGTVKVIGGTAGGTGAGAGSVGRIRVDAPLGSMLGFQGPQFAAVPLVGQSSLITRTATPMIAVRGNNAATFSYFFSNAAGMFSSSLTSTIGGNGQATFTVATPLFFGLNHFCITPAGGSPSSAPEAQNCIDIVYLMKQ